MAPNCKLDGLKEVTNIANFIGFSDSFFGTFEGD